VWYPAHRRAGDVARLLGEFEAAPSARRLGRVIGPALRG
jgi:hypothetical protein